MVITRSAQNTPGTSGADNEPPLTEQEIKIIQERLKQKEETLAEQSRELEIARREHLETVKTFEESHNLTEKEMGERTRKTEQNTDTQTLSEGFINEVDRLRSEYNRINHPTRRMDRRSLEPPFSLETSADITPKVSFREATESVPPFDGYNISLNQFTRACRRARDVVPPSSERNLTKLLINKLRDRAYSAVEDEPCETVTQLIDLLNTAFGSPKTIDQYRGELSTIYLKPREHMLDYIGRVKDLRTSILDAERREKGFLTERTVREVDGLAARSFCDGLPLEYRLQMGSDLHDLPFEAFTKAKTLAKRQELDKIRYGTVDRYETARSDKPLLRRPNSYPIAQELPPNRGYLQTRPPENNLRRAFIQSPSQADRNQRVAQFSRNVESSRTIPDPRIPNRAVEKESKVCRYCKYTGHTIEECRKRAYNNARKTETGNATGPADRTGERRPGPSPQHTRPVNPVEAAPTASTESPL